MPSTLKARRANNPHRCDITPGWLRTRSLRTVWRSVSIALSNDHLAVRGSGRHHGVDVRLACDGHVHQTGPGLAERPGEHGVRLGGRTEIVGVDAEAARDGGEIGLRVETRRVVAGAVEELLLLAH